MVLIFHIQLILQPNKSKHDTFHTSSDHDQHAHLCRSVRVYNDPKYNFTLFPDCLYHQAVLAIFPFSFSSMQIKLEHFFLCCNKKSRWSCLVSMTAMHNTDPMSWKNRWFSYLLLNKSRKTCSLSNIYSDEQLNILQHMVEKFLLSSA